MAYNVTDSLPYTLSVSGDPHDATLMSSCMAPLPASTRRHQRGERIVKTLRSFALRTERSLREGGTSARTGHPRLAASMSPVVA